ncbi:TfuA-like protein [Rhodobacteraceae bacterium]|nr:TfuA-like protein [Paracoccaceae bacterium]
MRAVAEGRTTIGLIDGGFEQGPAVWHKEILEAMDRGCTVFGASSMGALRAAELHCFGMIGLGQVFAEYVSGRRSSDADVAVIHGPGELGYPPLSLSLVEMEDVVARLLSTNAFDSETAELLLQTGRSVFFKERTWESLLCEVLDNADQCTSLLSLIDASGPAVKTRDAVLLLNTVTSPGSPTSPPISYARTTFISALIQRLEISL